MVALPGKNQPLPLSERIGLVAVQKEEYIPIYA